MLSYEAAKIEINEKIVTAGLDSCVWHSVGADGNCMYRGLAFVILGDENKHRIIRYLVVKFLEKYKRHFEAQLMHGLDGFLFSQIHDGQHGDTSIIYAASILFKVNINIFTAVQHSGNLIVWEFNSEGSEIELNLVQCGDFGREHFYVLQLSDEHLGTAKELWSGNEQIHCIIPPESDGDILGGWNNIENAYNPDDDVIRGRIDISCIFIIFITYIKYIKYN